MNIYLKSSFGSNNTGPLTIKTPTQDVRICRRIWSMNELMSVYEANILIVFN